MRMRTVGWAGGAFGDSHTNTLPRRTFCVFRLPGGARDSECACAPCLDPLVRVSGCRGLKRKVSRFTPFNPDSH